ncbi:sugar ABC transporter substrate-binding protein [Streptomyces sp. WI04-05B]|uniref:sugar ABC transporter substrate-binding protein n=1 Tax=Streptomyces TaxID=1883 RepID=UPI0029BACADB|nr:MULTISPECIES: sugar ABC transporter substrate-binding protein [unclassified Streptomyces]MDX2546963.1 sugar ABC transporter substrate-binding protein [Streptomyces sp. WI04-05B]MDX2589347.1 sugar ABC transporter substrate-binding protein [Streptomyces sp. WI04-05A]
MFNKHSQRLAAVGSVCFVLALSACSKGETADGGGTATAAAGAAKADALSTTVDAAYTGPDSRNFTTLKEPSRKDGTRFKVGFLTLNGGQPVLTAMQKAARAEVEKLGGQFIAKDASVDPQKQVSQLNELITAKVDVIIGHPVVSGALAPSVAEAKKAGIPFIAIGTPFDQTKAGVPGAVTAVVQGFDYIVYRTMKALSERHPGAAFATMGLALPVDQLTYMNARMQYWGEKFGLKFQGKVDAQNDTPSGFSPAASTILTKYPKTEIIVTYNDQSAVAAAAVVAAAGKKIFVATPNSGQSIGRDALKANRLDLVYRTPWEGMGTQSAIAAYDVVSKQNLPLPEIVNVPSYLVTAETADKAGWIG